MGDATARVLARIDDLHAETAELTQALVRIDSAYPNIPGVDPESVIGGETQVNEALEPYDRRAALDVTWVAPTTGAATSSASAAATAAAVRWHSTGTSTPSRRSMPTTG